MVTITILRPNHGLQLLTMDLTHLRGFRIYPDNKTREESVFPADAVTITGKSQGHLIIAQQHTEKWVLTGFSCATVDLSSFSDHWKGCSLIVFSDAYIH